ncbi:MAG: hypothetical protein KGH65_00195 [Candidatus Micrarchaeota archaeon]|nr:hypothetical protein [Candidatus Micrarchaeota archaeon]
MPEITVALALNSDRLRAFTYNEIELKLSVATLDAEPYWVECVYEVPHPLSLAPDKSLLTAKSLIGILQKAQPREKRVKIYASNEVYPSTYTLKVTLYLYDKDGAISERKEYAKEIECSEGNAKVLQSS